MGIGTEMFLKRNGEEEVIRADSPLFVSSDSGCLVGLTDDPNAY